MSILLNAALIQALNNTVKPVKWIRLNGEREQKIEPSRALQLAATGNYEGIGRHGRIKAIREVDRRQNRPWIDCWRTTQAAVLPPSAEYLRSLAGI